VCVCVCTAALHSYVSALVTSFQYHHHIVPSSSHERLFQQDLVWGTCKSHCRAKMGEHGHSNIKICFLAQTCFNNKCHVGRHINLSFF
jgi:hypothetical protein